jgi:hypothetical protein
VVYNYTWEESREVDIERRALLRVRRVDSVVDEESREVQ